MDNSDSDPQQPIIISSADARGGLDPETGSSSATLLPMLIGGLVLIIIGVIIVYALG